MTETDAREIGRQFFDAMPDDCVRRRLHIARAAAWRRGIIGPKTQYRNCDTVRAALELATAVWEVEASWPAAGNE